MNAPVTFAGVIDQLLSAPGEFEFGQAVDILQQLARQGAGAAPVGLGRGSDPRKEAVSLSASFELSFRAQPIERAAITRHEQRQLVVNFFGLAGADGPLPEAYVELIRADLLEHDSGAADFLSIFQHRLLSLAYRADNEFRAAGPFSEPGAGPLTTALTALLGQRAADMAPERQQLLLANLSICAQQRHSFHGFLMLLENQFGVKLSGAEWAGRWIALPAELQSVLGADGINDRLGRGAVLGRRAWNHDGGVRIDFGSIGPVLYAALLPGGARHRELCTLCAWYLGPNLCCYVRMALAPDQVPAPTLTDACLLGHTSWLGPAPAACAIELLVNNDGAAQ